MIPRRRFLQYAGTTLPGFPLLGSLGAASSPQTPKRLVCIGLDLSLRPETFFPGRSDEKSPLPPLLQPLRDWKGNLTAFSKMEHPGVSGGHSAVHAFLSGVRREQRTAFDSGCISLDQLVAAERGHLTRFPFLTFGVGGGDSIAWNASGSNLAKLEDPANAYEALFTPKSAAEKSHARALSVEDRQVAALLHGEAKRVSGRLDQWDREKLEEFVESVDQFEAKTRDQEKWLDAPIPKPEGPSPTWSDDGCIDKVRATLDVMALALLSDSTRVMTMNIGVGLPVAKRVPGVDRSYHDLSHSGRDPKKLAQLHKVETALISELDYFLKRLASHKDADGSSMLDNTIVLFGSGMGNASSHSNLDLPVLVAGGGLKHAPNFHFQKEEEDQTPLCNLYVTLLQQLGLERDQFGTSTGNLNELLG